MTFPISWVREQFSALRRGDTIFLDNAAGAQVPDQVVLNMTEALTTMNVNTGGVYGQSRRITQAKEEARALVAAFLNAWPGSRVAFGPNATTLVSLVACSLGERLQPRDEIVITGLDHHANRDPWRRLRDRGVVVKSWPVRGSEALLDPTDLEPLLSDRTRLVAMTAASNALGSLTPVKEVAQRIHALGAWLMVDGVHYAPHRLPDVQELGADLFVFSPYKVFGPHLGVLCLGTEVAAALGGFGLEFFESADPGHWEPGTQSHEAIYGFAGVFGYLEKLAGQLGFAGSGREAWQHAYAAAQRHEQELLERLLDGLDALGAVRYGRRAATGRTATVALNLPGRTAPEVARGLAEEGIAASVGHYYAYDLMMRSLGLRAEEGAVRLGLLHYNSMEEVERTLEVLARL